MSTADLRRDLQQIELPEGPLTMATLLAVEPAALRRVLKSGLRRGVTSDQLEAMLQEAWGCSIDTPEARELLERLAARGWFQADGTQWKTRLG